MKCRICNTSIFKPFVSLGNQPLSNSYLTEDELNKMEPYYPLNLYVCPECFLVQLEEFENAKNIFSSDYAYFSSYSESWLKHCKDYVEMMIDRFGYNENAFVVEIASNDGYLLQYFKQRNIPVLGIEPASNVAEVAIKKGISTDITFFDEEYAKNMNDMGILPDLIIGNNVLAHNPNLIDFVRGLKVMLDFDGVITLEFPHLLKLIKHNEFDTIYHEHFSYFSLHSVKKLLEICDLKIFDVDEIPTHGGSLRIYVKHKENSRKVSISVKNLLDREESAGILDLEFYNNFDEKIKQTKRNILQHLINAKNEGKKIVGYGAPAKGNTLLNYCGIRTDFIDYTVDISPHKQGKYLPGTHIPIFHPDKIKEDKPDYIIIFPWNIKDEIIKQLNYVREWNCKLITLIPEVKIHEI